MKVSRWFLLLLEQPPPSPLDMRVYNARQSYLTHNKILIMSLFPQTVCTFGFDPSLIVVSTDLDMLLTGESI